MTTAMVPYVYSADQHGHLMPWICAIHGQCMNNDHVGPFLPPLKHDKLLQWWRDRISEATNGTRLIVLLLPPTTPGKKVEGTELRGVAMFKMSDDETGAFRGSIDAVLIDRKYRRQGGARALVGLLELEAAKKGRTLLVVHTEMGSIAESAFKSFGYVEAGHIPSFHRVQASGTRGVTIFYKDLLASSSP